VLQREFLEQEQTKLSHFKTQMNVFLQLGVNRMFLIGTKYRSQTSVVKNRPATPHCHLLRLPRGQKITSNIIIHSESLNQLQILSCSGLVASPENTVNIEKQTSPENKNSVIICLLVVPNHAAMFVENNKNVFFSFQNTQ